MPQTVRSVRLQRFGGPEVLEIVSVDLPDPGPGEVLLNVEWIGLNRAELLWREGRYLVRPELPAPIGLECSGRIVETGEGVTKFSPGASVSVVPGTFDPRVYGTYAETILIPEAALLPTPGHVEGPATAAIWMAYLTAWGGLLDAGGLAEGWHVVISAASSSVGIAAIQLCLLEGAVPIAVTTSSQKVEDLEEIGAEHVIVVPRGEGDAAVLAREVDEITGGKGARLFFDPVGGPLLRQEIACAAPGARIIVYGLLDPRPAELDIPTVIGRGLRVEGYLLTRTTSDPQIFDVAASQIVDGLREEDLDPVIARVFPFDEIQEAHRFMESGEHFGKVVVEVE